MTTSDDVQRAVDELAAVIGQSVLIEDHDQRPVWWCTRGPVDPTRMRTILHRQVAPAAAAIVPRYRLRQAHGPVRTAADPEAEMWARWAIPVRHEGRYLGLLWVLDQHEALSEGDLQSAIDCADLAASVLVQTRQSAETVRLVREELIGRLVAGPDEEAVRELSRLEQMPHDAMVQVEAPGTTGGWILPDDMSAHVVSRRPRQATSGAPVPLVHLREAVRRAAATRRTIQAGAQVDPPTWDNLGAWRLVVEAPDDVAVESIHPAAGILAEHSRGDLLSTARMIVDNGGDVAGAAGTLHVHRTTVYYRVERIKDLTGVDLQDGEARTHLQLALWLAAYRATA
ncbi:PucR family transcriptional regulator [Ornithinimicrobium cavernae]|uniref:PucR family transcriptional regulator n=1 Tax=Ornithinimicrobium cavernae TaxID=2666047 RepID=UPI000D687C56|nr:helix-turn-helix domain-containing protein [Ornithinimicrobium cavernae]